MKRFSFLLVVINIAIGFGADTTSGTSLSDAIADKLEAELKADRPSPYVLSSLCVDLSKTEVKSTRYLSLMRRALDTDTNPPMDSPTVQSLTKRISQMTDDLSLSPTSSKEDVQEVSQTLISSSLATESAFKSRVENETTPFEKKLYSIGSQYPEGSEQRKAYNETVQTYAERTITQSPRSVEYIGEQLKSNDPTKSNYALLALKSVVESGFQHDLPGTPEHMKSGGIGECGCNGEESPFQKAVLALGANQKDPTTSANILGTTFATALQRIKDRKQSGSGGYSNFFYYPDGVKCDRTDPDPPANHADPIKCKQSLDKFLQKVGSQIKALPVELQQPITDKVVEFTGLPEANYALGDGVVTLPDCEGASPFSGKVIATDGVARGTCKVLAGEQFSKIRELYKDVRRIQEAEYLTALRNESAKTHLEQRAQLKHMLTSLGDPSVKSPEDLPAGCLNEMKGRDWYENSKKQLQNPTAGLTAEQQKKEADASLSFLMKKADDIHNAQNRFIDTSARAAIHRNNRDLAKQASLAEREFSSQINENGGAALITDLNFDKDLAGLLDPPSGAIRNIIIDHLRRSGNNDPEAAYKVKDFRSLFNGCETKNTCSAAAIASSLQAYAPPGTKYHKDAEILAKLAIKKAYQHLAKKNLEELKNLCSDNMDILKSGNNFAKDREQFRKYYHNNDLRKKVLMQNPHLGNAECSFVKEVKDKIKNEEQKQDLWRAASYTMAAGAVAIPFLAPVGAVGGAAIAAALGTGAGAAEIAAIDNKLEDVFRKNKAAEVFVSSDGKLGDWDSLKKSRQELEAAQSERQAAVAATTVGFAADLGTAAWAARGALRAAKASRAMEAIERAGNTPAARQWADEVIRYGTPEQARQAGKIRANLRVQAARGAEQGAARSAEQQVARGIATETAQAEARTASTGKSTNAWDSKVAATSEELARARAIVKNKVPPRAEEAAAKLLAEDPKAYDDLMKKLGGCL